ncbi:MAG: hypothetical protein CM1200mP2_33660 [Planctomycetaceae bacterium]|nr:MAG: hypothetical protein CM1200mP2_33660 [Planctomycetaceae bacterium]
MRLVDRLALLKAAGKATGHVPGKDPHQVQHVRTQHPEILASTPSRVLLATGSQFEHLSNLAVGDQLAGDGDLGRVTVAVGNRQLTCFISHALTISSAWTRSLTNGFSM